MSPAMVTMPSMGPSAAAVNPDSTQIAGIVDIRPFQIGFWQTFTCDADQRSADRRQTPRAIAAPDWAIASAQRGIAGPRTDHALPARHALAARGGRAAGPRPDPLWRLGIAGPLY
jgi:hypothetical protein